jgi:hypothetical protein
MFRKLGHRRRFAVKHTGKYEWIAPPSGKSRHRSRPDPEDGVDGSPRLKLLNLFAAILRKLVEDHLPSNVEVDEYLIAMHYAVGFLKNLIVTAWWACMSDNNGRLAALQSERSTPAFHI